mmetsp:Transcript_119388/g.223234  ORF Transcript_119388/g.223234 Transcript_119388/m.223234 type:complete len:222 (-) Transcript_119388:206-871(-)
MESVSGTPLLSISSGLTSFTALVDKEMTCNGSSTLTPAGTQTLTTSAKLAWFRVAKAWHPSAVLGSACASGSSRSRISRVPFSASPPASLRLPTYTSAGSAVKSLSSALYTPSTSTRRMPAAAVAFEHSARSAFSTSVLAGAGVMTLAFRSSERSNRLHASSLDCGKRRLGSSFAAASRTDSSSELGGGEADAALTSQESTSASRVDSAAAVMRASEDRIP